MTLKDIEQAILGIITKIYCKKYIGKIKVQETFNLDQHLGYVLYLGLNNDDVPLSIAGEGSCEQFLSFIEKELKAKQLDSSEYFEATQLYRADEKKCRLHN